MAFKSAEDRIDDDSFDAIWAILTGDSSWKAFITPAAEATKKNLPAPPFRVVPPADYAPQLAALDKSANPNDTPGVTDKKKGLIWMSGYFGTNSREAMLGHALHETVHLVSHKPGRSGQQHSSAIGVLGEGMLEGLVEHITTNILTTQKITLASPGKRGHQQRVPVVEELMTTYGITMSLLGTALFGGNSERLFRVAEAAFTTTGWIEIQRLTTANTPDKARKRMAELRAAEEGAHPSAFKAALERSGPRVLYQIQPVFR